MNIFVGNVDDGYIECIGLWCYLYVVFNKIY